MTKGFLVWTGLAGLCPERPENNALYVSVLEYANKVPGQCSMKKDERQVSKNKSTLLHVTI